MDSAADREQQVPSECLAAKPQIGHPSRPDDGRRYRVAFLNSHPIQYFAPLYAYLNLEAGFDVTAIYVNSSVYGCYDKGFGQTVTWNVDLLAGYDYVILGPSRQDGKQDRFRFINTSRRLWAFIHNGKFDAIVIHGHNTLHSHIALLAAKSAHSLAMARGETHLLLQRPLWRDCLRKPILKLLYTFFDAFLAIGSANAQYYSAMGVPQQRIFIMPYSVHNDRFTESSHLSPVRRIEARTRLGIDGDAPVILFASKFEPRKRPLDLLKAYDALRCQGVDARLVMVGTGLLFEECQTYVADRCLPDVVFAGFVNQAELPEIYGASDVFVLPSENEPWGLVVNEAMCAGLPIVASREVGSVQDLVSEGVNGSLFDARDIDGLINALRPILTDPSLRERYRIASTLRIARWGFMQCGTALRSAVTATKKGSPQALDTTM